MDYNLEISKNNGPGFWGTSFGKKFRNHLKVWANNIRASKKFDSLTCSPSKQVKVEN